MTKAIKNCSKKPQPRQQQINMTNKNNGRTQPKTIVEEHDQDQPKKNTQPRPQRGSQNKNMTKATNNSNKRQFKTTTKEHNPRP